MFLLFLAKVALILHKNFYKSSDLSVIPTERIKFIIHRTIWRSIGWYCLLRFLYEKTMFDVDFVTSELSFTILNPTTYKGSSFWVSLTGILPTLHCCSVHCGIITPSHRDRCFYFKLKDRHNKLMKTYESIDIFYYSIVVVLFIWMNV